MRDDGAITLGRGLRDQREARGLTLKDLARATRIGAEYLDALESDRLTELPAPVFVKGFIRAYCEQLDEPPDEHLRRYRHVLGDRSDVEAQPAAPPRRRVQMGTMSVTLILVGVLGAGLAVLTQIGRADRGAADRTVQAPPAPQPAAPERLPAPPPATPAAPSRESPPPGPLTATGRELPGAPPLATNPPSSQPVGSPPLKLTVRAVERTWLRVQTAGGQLAEEELEPGAVREWVSDSRFLLTVGNAGGLEVSLNGRRMPPLGGRGVVVRRVEIPGPSPSAAGTRR